MTDYHFKIAGWHVTISFVAEDKRTGIHLLPSLEPFRTEKNDDEPSILNFVVDNSIRPVERSRLSHIRTFDTGNGDTVVYRLSDGGYQYIIRDTEGYDCALLICDSCFSNCRCAVNGDADMRRYGINNALMLCYAFAGSLHDTLLIHASLVRHRGYAYAFIARSGTGKSTQTANWLRMIPDCDLMNDDNPVIRVHDGGRIIIYGSPWSGKTPCYRNISAPLAAVTQIDRTETNSVEHMDPLSSFGLLLSACSTMKWDKKLYSRICDTVSVAVSHVPVYVLHCTAHPQSAVVCHDAIAIKEER